MYSHEKDVEESMKAGVAPGGWNNLGVVHTIFEDDDEDLESLSSPPLSFSNSSPPSPLQSSVDAWTATTGKKPDVKIVVRGVGFLLHKDPLISKSSYLKRQLTRVSEFTLSPPLKISANTFKQVADFCYVNQAIVTPFNVAALRTAAELLEMNGDGEESLRDVTEAYFCDVLQDNREFTCNVFYSCLSLLPEAEQTAFLASRCLEALFSAVDDGDSGGAVGCADGLKKVPPENFKLIADSMQRRYTRSHDLLYRLVDLYFLVYNGKLSDDQKTQICSCIDCSILSASLLMHAVQNLRMPLRFVVQSMLIEQLNTHRTIFSALNTTSAVTTTTKPRPLHDIPPPDSPAATLGAILERDAALRQVAHLRAAVETTCSRIQTLEKELSNMKRLLVEQEQEKQQKGGGLLLLEDGRRSASCRFSYGSSNSKSNKVERGERGSISSSMIRFKGAKNTDLTSHGIVGSSSSFSQSDYHQSPKVIKTKFGQRLMRSLRNAFKLKDGKLEGKDHHNINHKIIGYEKEEMIFDA